MNIFLLNALLLSSLFFKNFGFISYFSQPEPINVSTKNVKVLLHQFCHNISIQLFSKKGFLVKEENKKTKQYGSQITITYKKNSIFVNGIAYKTSLTIQSNNGIIAFNKNNYQGLFIIQLEKQKAFVINQLNVEDYVFSVLKTESWPGWPLEMNKVLAIVCRTYALCMIADAEKTRRPYHVTNTNLFQTYNGLHQNTVIGKAVDETKGIIIHYEKKPILAMYDSCCGGIIPAKVSSFDFSKKPYLARNYACNYCKYCKLYKWQTSMPEEHFAKQINFNTRSIQAIKVTKKDKAGIAQEVTVKTKKLSTMLKVQKIYSLSKDIKSFSFDVYKKGNNIIFFGRGYGHHIGLCQWGAYEMVKKGYGFKKILSYYYPGTLIGKII